MEEEVIESVKEEIPSDAIVWDHPSYYVNNRPFIPYIFESPSLQSPIPPGFNTVKIELDGQLKADLAWKQEREKALRLIEQGYFIFWDMKLGLFSNLTLPLPHQTQYLSLGLSLEHFRDTLWKEFKYKSLGLGVYRGPLDFSVGFPWDDQQLSNLQGWLQDRFSDLTTFKQETGLSLTGFKESTPSLLTQSEGGRQLIRLFCRDAAVEYLGLLTSSLPDGLPRYLQLDARSIQNPLWQVQLLHGERFDRFQLVVKGANIPVPALGWGHSSMYGLLGELFHPTAPSPLPVKVGVCLPLMELVDSHSYRGLKEGLEALLSGNIPFRLIPETFLTTEWDGLDYLLYMPTGLGPQGKRKLQGFCAAGGTVVTVGKKLGLPQEIFLSDFLEEKGKTLIDKNRKTIHF